MHTYQHNSFFTILHLSKECTVAGDLFSTLLVVIAFWPAELLTTIDRELQVGQITNV